MIEFLIRNNIINFTGSDYLCIIHQTPLKSNFSFLYNSSLFHAIETKDKKGIRKYENKAMGFAIMNKMTIFYSRPENYFELTYDSLTKEWGVVPTFFDELIEHIESGELFGENDGNFFIYNTIIKYFNDIPITIDDIELIQEFQVKKHHMLFYAIPAIKITHDEYL